MKIIAALVILLATQANLVTEPYRWRAVGEGVTLAQADNGLRASYRVTSGKPSGAASPVPRGTFAGVKAVRVRVTANRNTSLIVSLQNGTGVAYAFPAIAARAGTRTVELSVDDLSFLPQQSKGADPGSFDVAETILITIIDISGFMSAETPEVTWTIEALEGVREPRKPIALKSEESFFRALNRDPKLRPAAMRELTTAYAVDPADARTTLLLGLAHLWSAAEGDRTNAATIENVMLAEHYLTRAQKLAPEDGRIPSWLVPTRLALGRIERNRSETARVEGDLYAAYEKDPNFHSFTVALLGWAAPRDSAEFARGLKALRDVPPCGDVDPSCADLPHWPNNRAGFLIFRADYELKAGRADEARRLLESIKALPTYGSFMFPEEVDERLAKLQEFAALYANADRGDDPPTLVLGDRGCQVCHRGKEQS